MSTQFKGNSEQVLALDTFIKLIRATNTVEARFRGAFKKHNLTESQFGVLEALFHLGPLKQKELAQKILKSGGNLTLVIDNLEKRDLVIRCKDKNDRRVYKVQLTESGESLIKEIFPKHAKEIQNTFSVLTQKERITLGKLCKKLGTKLSEGE
jgi:MarR family 2-MHQ and catechol resistance regulon transcriptional repressor